MADYRSDQYYNLANAGEDSIVQGTGVSRLSDYGNVNKDFAFPDRTIRTINRDGERVDHLLQRGYIRSLIDESQGYEVPINRCRFQFNPSTLNQYVAANTGMLNVLQQDPAQWSQPLAADVSFNFQLIFDRSHELNSPNGSYDRIADLETTNLWESLPPEQIGVLHDLGLLFSVIGVGISESQKQYVSNLLENRTALEAANDVDVLAGDAEASVVATGAKSNIPTLLEFNVGNSGFLIPLPVRAVFSSLYIVEGLARSVGVIFTKFNRAMVPMRCTVDVQMEAKYIGFAKKKTFFTSALEEAKDAARTQWISDQEKKEAVHTAASRILTAINIKTVKDFDVLNNQEYDDSDYKIENLIEPSGSDSGYATTIAQFPNAIGWRQDHDGQDPIIEFFDQGSQVSIEVNLYQTFYRYSPELAEVEGAASFGSLELIGLKGASASERVAAFNIANTPKTAVRRETDQFITPIYHATTTSTPQYGRYSKEDAVNTSATTKEEWIALSRFLCAAPGRPWNTNGSTFGYLDNDSDFYDYDRNDYYFAIKFGGTVTVAVDGYSITGIIGSSSIPDLGFVFGHLDRANRSAGLGANIKTGIELPIYWPSFVMDEIPPQWADDQNNNNNNNGSNFTVADIPEDIILSDPGLAALLP
jgi:hypothetical protein